MSYNRGYNNYGNGNQGNRGEQPADKPTTFLLITTNETDSLIAIVNTYSRGGTRTSNISICKKINSVGGHDRWQQIKYVNGQDPMLAISNAERLLEQAARGDSSNDDL